MTHSRKFVSRALACALALLWLCATCFSQGGSSSGGISFGPAGAPNPPHITNGVPPNGTQGAPYDFHFTGTCPNGPCTWSQLSGTLPAGSTLASNGTLHADVLGAATTYTFSVRFTDTFTGLTDTNPVPYVVIVAAQVPGAFMVSNGGDNAHGCSFLQPCNGDLAGFAAAQTAVQLLPSGSKTVTLRGAVPSAQEDLLKWVTIGVSGRTGTHKTGTSLYDATWLDQDLEKIWTLKTSGGNPWDIDTYGAGCTANWICLWMTENGDIFNGFNIPQAYKRFTTPVAIMPRYFTSGTRIVVDTPAPPTKNTANCELDSPGTTSPGDTRGVTEGIFNDIDFGGDIGQAPYILNSYYYSGTISANVFHDRERRYYILGEGRVKWDHSTCTGSGCNDLTPTGTTPGTWIVASTSLKNALASGGAPVPNFPCGNTIPGWIGGPVPTSGQNLLPADTGVYRLPSTLTFASGDSGTGSGDRVVWKNYPGESATITGHKRITGLTYVGGGEYDVSLTAASTVNFETLYVNGLRRSRPIAGGTAHGYAVNNCATSQNDDPDVCRTGVAGGGCTTGTAQQIASCQCGMPGVLVAASQSKVCNPAGSTPWECKNIFKYSVSDINPSWHAFKLLELDAFEDWTMSRLRPLSASAGIVSLSGPSALTNNHGCEGGHHYIVENVRENFAAGQWYLEQDANNDGAIDSTWTLRIKASPGDNLLAADIEVPQLAVSTPVVSLTGVNWFTFLSNNAGSFAGLAGAPLVSGLFFEGDNWQPPSTGYADGQGMPDVTGAVTFTNANNVLIDGVTIRHTTGWCLDWQATVTHNTVQNGELTDCGAGGVRFGTSVAGQAAGQPGDTDLNVPQYNTVQEMLIDNTGRIQPGGEPSPIFLGDGHHNIFQHNEIINSRIGGIELCFYLKRGTFPATTSGFCHDNQVKFNKITGSPNSILVDHAAIYLATSLSSASAAGTPLTGGVNNEVSGNVISFVNSNYDLPAGAASLQGKGIYLDQGSSHNLIKNNLVYYVAQNGIFLNQPENDTTSANHFLPQDNLVDNNIFAFFGYQNAAFTTNVAESCVSKNGQNGNAFTFQRNVCYSNFTNNFINMQNLPSASWLCYADDLVTQVPCSQRYMLANNVYWNKFGLNPLQFAVPKTPTSPPPVNNTNYWRFGPSNAVMPTGWQAAWQLDGSGNLLSAGEDAGSIAADPLFVSTTCGAEDFHYTRNFAAQGIVPFDFTVAGRQTNTMPIPSVPDLFPLRPAVCSDYNNAGGGTPVVSLSVPSLTFSSQTIFTTSAPQSVTLTNTGTAILNVASVTATGDFAQTNTCTPSVAAGGNCTITVTFTPTGLGARTGSIAITDNAAGSPQSVSLTGTGTATTGAGDNRYCGLGNVVTGLSDSTWGTVTAQKLQHCMNTDRANTPSPGTVRVVTDNASLTAAIGAMVCGDEIRITKASHLTGTYVLPAKGCNDAHWMTIDSSGVLDPSFPPEGTRTSPCWSGIATLANRPPYPCPAPQELTARITVPKGASGAFQIKGDHYRFIGLEITRDAVPGIVFDLIDTPLGVAIGVQHHIIVDRCYPHGFRPDAELPYTAAGQSKDLQKGIFLGISNNFAVIDSYIDDVYCIGSFGSCSDAQTIAGGVSRTTDTMSGWGTYKFVNNHLTASTEGILLGGSSGPNLTPLGCTPLVNCNVDSPSDNEIRRNYFFKPVNWNCNTTVVVTAGCPVEKNGVEFKNAVRTLFRANVIRNTWNGAATPQGWALLIAPKNSAAGPNPSCMTCEVSDFIGDDNYGYNLGEGFGLYTSLDPCGACASLGGFRIVLRDNLLEAINKGSLSTNSVGDGFEISSNTGSPLDQVAIVHNTILPTIRSYGLWGAMTTGLQTNFYWENNIITVGTRGLLHIGGGGTCDNAFTNQAFSILNACVSPYSFQKNDILGGSAAGCDGATNCWPTDGAGANNFFHTTSTILFTNYNGGNSNFNPGNYLLQSGSPGHNAGTDGKDLGADINAILTAISGVSVY